MEYFVIDTYEYSYFTKVSLYLLFETNTILFRHFLKQNIPSLYQSPKTIYAYTDRNHSNIIIT